MECFFDLMVSVMYVLMIHASRNEMREKDTDTVSATVGGVVKNNIIDRTSRKHH